MAEESSPFRHTHILEQPRIVQVNAVSLNCWHPHHMKSCGIDSHADCSTPVERPPTPKRPDEHQRGPPETSRANFVRPQQQAPRSGNPQMIHEPSSRLSDEESEAPAGKGSPSTPPTTGTYPVASTGSSGPYRMAAWKHHPSVKKARSGT